MTPAEFVECCRREKESLLATYLDSSSEAAVARLIGELEFAPQQQAKLREVLDGALTDAFYTLLLALDGEASLGGKQSQFTLRDESGTELSGHLEGEAWRQFHGGKGAA